MPAPYSQDLRERVIGFLALGGSARAAATRFDVSVSSATRWAPRWRAEGHARPRAMGGDRRCRLSEHTAKVLQLIAQQPDLTLQEIRNALAASCGITVGLSTVHRYLGAQNLTRKKTRLAKLAGIVAVQGWPGRHPGRDGTECAGFARAVAAQDGDRILSRSGVRHLPDIAPTFLLTREEEGAGRCIDNGHIGRRIDAAT